MHAVRKGKNFVQSMWSTFPSSALGPYRATVLLAIATPNGQTPSSSSSRYPWDWKLMFHIKGRYIRTNLNEKEHAPTRWPKSYTRHVLWPNRHYMKPSMCQRPKLVPTVFYQDRRYMSRTGQAKKKVVGTAKPSAPESLYRRPPLAQKKAIDTG
jgi:hypothetical protein